ncbi:cbb3-type cytochrome oxidase assembly protein CcoS [Poseidonibacter lekithochrous]|uniref:cbb3-type cytochrome oxidase assembly protein CcoS n=1 Tax=Poseidonibacter lekithochrous TaxID=1904463 RepID=UPI0008FC4886|nr:cbb3-type cytochrome oxidase assembly protein CcoS [Poseidonibacter lekithochrous]QKJ22091.1 cytochrome oxidase maturation protein, cbb3-type [Poseidonibacter lekithochrous]
MISDTLFMMLVVGLIISFALLLLFVWGAKSGQFDDSNKMVDGLLFDSVEDLNDAINKENKLKNAKESKIKKDSEKEDKKS